MAFNGKEGEQISLEEGAAMTANYRNSEHAYGARAQYIGKQIIASILQQTGCVGMRMYYALDADGAKQLVIVGVNAEGNDMTTGIIADRTLGCPTYCDTNSSPL
jgi:hypothetical protein